MITKSTVRCFSSIISFESIFCINRSYLFTNKRTKIFLNTISIAIFSSISILTGKRFINNQISLGNQLFQAFLATEFIFLVFTARFSDGYFTAFNKLDERCGTDIKLIRKLENEVRKQCIIGIISIVIDAIGMFVLDMKIGDIINYVLLFSAHDTELALLALVIEGMNLRLVGLSFESPLRGSAVYRHVLIASDQINEVMTIKILIMLAVTLVTTTCFACAIMLMYSGKVLKLAAYLLWRELKTLYCVWKLCRASHASEVVCQQLCFQLAKKLALDPAYNKLKHPEAYQLVRRWYTAALQQRPRYVRGSVYSIGNSVPLHILDISINYVLIIVQIYVAYR